MKIFVLFFITVVTFASAAPVQRDLVVEDKIEQELAKLDPTMVAPFRQARVALDAGDYATSTRLLREVVAKVPNFDPALRRLGSSLASIGDRTEGLRWAEAAVALNRSGANLSSLAGVLAFTKTGHTSDHDLRRAQRLLKEARGKPDGKDVSTLLLSAQIAFQLRDLDDVRSLVAQLEHEAPDQLGTHYLAAYLAAVDEHWVKADREMQRAKELGLDADTANRFLDSGVHSRALAWRAIGIIAWVIGVWAIGLAGLCTLGFLLSRITLRQMERADPNEAISPREHRLRQIYRSVLNIAGIYYYISLPVIVVLVILFAGGIIYGFIVAGWLPIKLMLILGIGAIATIWSMGRSLFLRVKAEDPGRVLARPEAEGLWQLAEDVATTLKTRPIDEIRVTPGTDLCVYERGSWREKMEGKAARVLVIGTAILNGFKQEEFRSVLAHEYGHFAHRDTAGGDIALRVRSDIWKFYLAMVRAGQATKLNVAFHFLRFYNFIFRRISHGATRLQEVLADRVAAQAYGPAAFEGGLRHVIRRSIEFDSQANAEIKAAIDAERPIRNLYEPVTTTNDTADHEFEKAVNRQTSADDTHPSPIDRFRLVSRVTSIPRPPNPGLVWELFGDPNAMQREMMETLEKRILSRRGTSYRPPLVTGN